MSTLGPLIVIGALVVLVVAVVRRSQGRPMFAEQSPAARAGYVAIAVVVVAIGIYLSTSSH